jgi:hypothetical protein
MVVQEQGSGTVLTAALAGLVAAIAGGVVWALIVRWTDSEIGFVAWGIGFLVGTAVVFGARNARGVPFQVVAVLLALAGIVIGKYLAFVWVGQDVLGDELGALGFDLPVFSTDTFDLWWDARDDVWGGWDLLWVGLAVVTAFRIPKHEREAPAEQQETGDAPPNRPETGTDA